MSHAALNRSLRFTVASKPSGRRGAVVAELAILLPLLTLMFVIAVDFCRVFFASQAIESCAYSAAMYASGVARGDSETSAEQLAKEAAVADGKSLTPPLQAEQVVVAISGGQATVTIAYDFALFQKYLGSSGTQKIRRSVQMTQAPRAGGP